jgi:hypothetical protein
MLCALLLYVVLMGGVHAWQPAFVYRDDGSFRQFGIGFRQTTVVPMWAVSILLAILSYVAVQHWSRG